MGRQHKIMSGANMNSIIHWSTQCIDLPNVINGTSTVINNDYNVAKALADSHDLTWQILASLMIASGLLLTFAGYSLFYLTLAMTGFFAGFAITFGVTCGGSGSALAACIVGFLGACLFGYLTTRAERLGVYLIGTAGGFASYMCLNAIVLNKLYVLIPASHQTYTPALVCVSLALFGAVLAGYLEKHIIIGTTSIAGAYMVGFGADRLAFKAAHHNLNPLVLMSGGGCHSSQCYAVLGGIVLLAVVGFMVQMKKTSTEKYENRFSRIEYEYAPANDLYYDSENGMLTSANARRVSRERVVL